MTLGTRKKLTTLEIPFNEGSLIRARHGSLQRAAHRALFPHYYGVKRFRISNSNAHNNK